LDLYFGLFVLLAKNSMDTNRIANHFDTAERVLRSFNTKENHERIAKAAQIMVDGIKSGGHIYSCGNGGSMCDAMHFAEELTGRYRHNRPGVPALSISDSSHMSCVSNDFGYEFVFSRFLEAFGKKGDVLLAISTSGNSTNVLNAMHTAREKGMAIIGLTGKDGGKMATGCDIEIRAPHAEYADRAQEIHIKVIHTLIDTIEAELFGM
jgi:D-sedoheptulose 7-phosphate isomerase